MNLRGKIFCKENKKVYKVLVIDFTNQHVLVKDNDVIEPFSFNEVNFLASTGVKAENSYIYQNDFIIAIKEKIKHKGVVKKHKDGWYYLHDKKLKSKLNLEKLVEERYKIINLGNAVVYFEKLRTNKK